MILRELMLLIIILVMMVSGGLGVAFLVPCDHSVQRCLPEKVENLKVE